jgi:hypothetical protein
MTALIATRTVRYGRTEYKEGEPFEASEKDAKLLIAIKKAKLVTKAPKIVDLSPEVMSRASKAEPLTEHEATVFTKRRYRRRDITAE